MVVWGFWIGDRYLKFPKFCIKIVLQGIQKSEITDCDTRGCGRWVKIGDYGLSKAFDLAGLSGHTFTGAKMGTPAFMCRQQLLDLKNSLPEVDIWASAACLYNMLTGYFPRDFVGDPWASILKNDPVPIGERDISIPENLAKVIDLALTEKPQIHFQTAAELKETLLKTM